MGRTVEIVFKAAGNITGQIANYLAQQIIRGSLRGGARIQEVKVAQSLGVSRGSVREALLILQRQHLIEIVPRKGAVVSSMSADDVSELIGLAGVLEGSWLPRVARRTDNRTALVKARGALQDMERGARDGDLLNVLAARSDLYRALVEPHGTHARAVFDCVLPSMERLLHSLIGRADVDLHDIPRYYGALLDAIDNKNLDRINELLKAFQNRLIHLCDKLGWVVERAMCDPRQQAANGT